MGVREWPGMRSQYAVLPPHDEPTVTGPGQVGIAFSGHARLPWESAGRTRVSDIAPGSAIVTGADGIAWLTVAEPTEALEVYPDPHLLRALAGGAADPPLAVSVGVHDGVVLAVGSVLRRVHATGGALSDVAASTLAHRLATHLLDRYAGLRPAGPGRGGPAGLDARTVDRVAQFVDADLDTTLTLDRLAAVACLSPFHFARAFKRSTGLTPHAFVTSRRIDRARHLLRTGSDPVDEVARAVGFSNLSHFRRTFRRHTALTPSALRLRLRT